MTYTWVIGSFTGERAKSVKAHAEAGIGYFIRGDAGRGNAYEVEAAFRRADDSPLPEHLRQADNYQAEKLDKMYADRHNTIKY